MKTARRQRPWESSSFPRSWANSAKTACRSRNSHEQRERSHLMPCGLCAEKDTEQRRQPHRALLKKNMPRLFPEEIMSDDALFAGHRRKKSCPTMPGKKGRYLRYNDKAIRLAQRRAWEDTPEFRDRYRFRAGIEGTMSQLDRLTGVKNLRVRGLSAVSFAAFLKAAGINIIRAAVHRNRENEGEPALIAVFSMLSCAVKERLQIISAAIRHWTSLRRLDLQVAALYAV